MLKDRDGQPHSFKVTLHPVVPAVHNFLASGLLPQSTVRIIGNSSSYAAAVSKALDAGEALADLSVIVAPIGLTLHNGKLEITGGA